ncbi:MAG: bifunctional DNA-formamidopyrimidine glycosylase/DNA-(apurinic or apyrimidinic site) lyase [Methylococcales bacterium]
MPELPEVETTRLGIAPHIVGKKIQQIIIRQPKLRWPVPDALAASLIGRTINSVNRRAKYLLFTTDSGTMLIHLGMSGNLRIQTATDEVRKHDHLDFVFSEQLILRFNDQRRFGAVLWTTAPIAEHALLKDLGPEPLSDAFNGELLHCLAKNRKIPVKSFIMDSHIVVGVGNIYANEALFMAGLHPLKAAGHISLAEYQKLAACIRQILGNAIQQGGTTLRDFVNAAGKPGYFQQQLSVYGRSGLACINCANTLEEIRIANRSSVFCSQCQR